MAMKIRPSLKLGKKLALHRETVVRLAEDELAHVGGAQRNRSNDDTNCYSVAIDGCGN
jgi:hypothetical protein